MRVTRTTLIRGACVGVLALATLVTAGPASATPDNDSVAFAAAFRGSDGDVWVNGASGNGDLHLAMRAGSRPSVVQAFVKYPSQYPFALGYQVFFVSPAGALLTVGPMGWQALGVHVDPGTNPSAALPDPFGDAVHVVWQSGGQLRYGSWIRKSGHLEASTIVSLGLGMMPGTSPDIATVGGHFDVIAFQANTGKLWFRTNPVADVHKPVFIQTPLGMKAGTSPSVAGSGSILFEAAFQANTGHLWFGGSGKGYQDTGVAMAPGTSPTIAGYGGYTIAYETATHQLGAALVSSYTGPLTAVRGTSPVSLKPSDSPSVTIGDVPSTTSERAEVAYVGAGGQLRYATYTWDWNSPAPQATFTAPGVAAAGGVGVG